jgi:hypothetical protein
MSVVTTQGWLFIARNAPGAPASPRLLVSSSPRLLVSSSPRLLLGAGNFSGKVEAKIFGGEGVGGMRGADGSGFLRRASATPTTMTKSEADMTMSRADMAVSVADMTMSKPDMTVSVADMTVSVADMTMSVADMTMSVADMTVSVTDMTMSRADMTVSAAHKTAAAAEIGENPAKTHFSRNHQPATHPPCQTYRPLGTARTPKAKFCDSTPPKLGTVSFQ